MDDNLPLVKKCLTLISRIAARGASSPVPEHVHDTLFELTHALRSLDPPSELPAHEMINNQRNLQRLHDELDFIDSTSAPLTAHLVLKYSARSTWN